MRGLIGLLKSFSLLLAYMLVASSPATSSQSVDEPTPPPVYYPPLSPSPPARPEDTYLCQPGPVVCFRDVRIEYGQCDKLPRSRIGGNEVCGQSVRVRAKSVPEPTKEGE